MHDIDQRFEVSDLAPVLGTGTGAPNTSLLFSQPHHQQPHPSEASARVLTTEVAAGGNPGR